MKPPLSPHQLCEKDSWAGQKKTSHFYVSTNWSWPSSLIPLFQSCLEALMPTASLLSHLRADPTLFPLIFQYQTVGTFPIWNMTKQSNSLHLGSPWFLSSVTFYHHLIFFFFLFLVLHPKHMEGPRLGVESEPQQHQVRAASATYTTAHANARSLTHWGQGSNLRPHGC